MDWLRNLGRMAARLAATLVMTVAGYGLAAWIGSSWAAGQQAPLRDEGVTIWVETNGIHTGLIVPLANEQADFSGFASPDHARAAPQGATHMLVGWGHAGIYRETPEWRDLRLTHVLSAIFGSNETVMHITFIAEPQADNALQRRVLISEAAYRRLAARITERFARDAAHQRGYGDEDVFYDSVGRYSWLVTCNSWTGDLLREAGVPMGQWTPFAGGVMKWLPPARR